MDKEHRGLWASTTDPADQNPLAHHCSFAACYSHSVHLASYSYMSSPSLCSSKPFSLPLARGSPVPWQFLPPSAPVYKEQPLSSFTRMQEPLPSAFLIGLVKGASTEPVRWNDQLVSSLLFCNTSVLMAQLSELFALKHSSRTVLAFSSLM